MSKDFLYLRHWLTGEGYSPDYPPRPVILECIRSRSGMSMGVYDRRKRIFTVNGCGFDRIGTALGNFLEACFRPEMESEVHKLVVKPHVHLPFQEWVYLDSRSGFYGVRYRISSWVNGETANLEVSLEGATGFESMAAIAQAIGLKVHRSESKAGTLIIIEKKGS